MVRDEEDLTRFAGIGAGMRGEDIKFRMGQDHQKDGVRDHYAGSGIIAELWVYGEAEGGVEGF